MAIKETITYTRPNTSIMWLSEFYKTDQAIKNIERPLINYSSFYQSESLESDDGKKMTVTRTWSDKNKFIESRSVSNEQLDNEFYNYIFDNGFTLNRSIEEI